MNHKLKIDTFSPFIGWVGYDKQQNYFEVHHYCILEREKKKGNISYP